jgi:hypothetical protein
MWRLGERDIFRTYLSGDMREGDGRGFGSRPFLFRAMYLSYEGITRTIGRLLYVNYRIRDRDRRTRDTTDTDRTDTTRPQTA